MNAAARAIHPEAFTFTGVFSWLFSRQTILLILLIVSVLSTAFAVVYVKNLNRRMFSELQSAQKVRDDLQVEWGQLLLEQSTWATQARVQRLAHQRLNMVLPSADDIEMVGR